MVNTINDNFQKVFTLPFLQGDDGDMISTEFCPFWVQDNGVDYLTQEGAKIFNTIFQNQISNIYGENVVSVFYGCEYDKNGVITNKGTTYNEFKKILCEGDEGDENIKGLNLFDSKNVNEYFNTARVNRQKAHDEALEALNDIIKDSTSSPEAVVSAEKSLEEISKTIKLETDLENLISAKTNGECVVVINDGKAQVILNKNTLNDTISTQIIDIIASQANIFSENITLIETK